MKITVVGCGNGAFATAADLSYQGHEVTMYVDSSHRKNFSTIEKTMVIKAVGKEIAGDIPIHEVTTSEERAFANPELILVTVPAYAQEDVAGRIAPYVKDGANIILSPGGTGGALVFARALGDRLETSGVRIGEFHTLPYAARRSGSDGVNIILKVRYLLFAAFPAVYNDELFERVKQIYPSAVLASDVLETSLNNGNAVTHPAPIVLNAGKIEYYHRHNHYEEGITPSVGRVVQMIDDERKNICRAFGYTELDIKDRLYRMGYCPEADTVYESIQGSKDVFLPIHGPDDLGDRYLTEDAPYSLVAMTGFADAAGLNTPLMDAVVELASALREANYWGTGRTLERMGLEDMNPDEIKAYLQTGVLPG